MEISNAYYQTLAAGHGVEETAARCAKTQQLQQAQERRQLRPATPEKALQCPRCASTNTKFCYYNNYSLSQPRHFCKGCKRYWTQGGSLRNVPVRGGCRKHKKHSSSSSSSSSSSKKASSEQDLSSSITALIPPPNLYFAGQPPTKQLVGASAIPSGFLDMLRSGSVGSAAVVGGGGAAHGSFGSVYCGGEENAELWFESTQAAISPSTINIHLPWQDAAGSMLLDCSWSGNAAVGDSWQGLIDSSLL